MSQGGGEDGKVTKWRAFGDWINAPSDEASYRRLGRLLGRQDHALGKLFPELAVPSVQLFADERGDGLVDERSDLVVFSVAGR